MTVIEIEPETIQVPEPDDPEPYDPDTDEFPDTQEVPDPDWNI